MSSATSAHSVVEPSPTSKRIAGAIVILYALITMIPLAWIFLTSYQVAAGFHQLSAEDRLPRRRSRAIATCSRRGRGRRRNTSPSLGPPTCTCDEVTRKRNMVIAGPSNYLAALRRIRW